MGRVITALWLTAFFLLSDLFIDNIKTKTEVLLTDYTLHKGGGICYNFFSNIRGVKHENYKKQPNDKERNAGRRGNLNVLVERRGGYGSRRFSFRVKQDGGRDA